MFNKQVRLSIVSRKDNVNEIKAKNMKNNAPKEIKKSEELLRGLVWDQTYTRVLAWSNYSLFIVKHSTNELEYSHDNL